MTLVKGLGPEQLGPHLPVLEGGKVMLMMLEDMASGEGAREPQGEQEWEVGPKQPTPVHVTDHFPLAERSEKDTWRMGSKVSKY